MITMLTTIGMTIKKTKALSMKSALKLSSSRIVVLDASAKSNVSAVQHCRQK